MPDDQVVDLLLRGIASRQARGHPPAVGSLLLALDLAVKQRGVSRRPTVNPQLEARLVRAVRALDERALRRLQVQSTNLSKAALTWLGIQLGVSLGIGAH